MNDIRPLKKQLRQKYRTIRQQMHPAEKEWYDRAIFSRLIDMPFYKRAESVLCFVSTEIEVDTEAILLKVLADGKKLAVPKCLDRKGNMDFFQIHSLQELSPGEFSLMEPDPAKAPRFTAYQNSICVLPAFAFDREGYRLGFGMGYYDRFLHRFTGLKVGICYNSCIAPSLPHGRFDVPADYIITPKYTLTVRKTAAEDKGDKI